MAETTSIEWTATILPDGRKFPGYTFNPIWGCTKISPACTNCYAATWANRYGVGWGPKAERRTFGEKHWAQPLKWNREAAASGIRRKVFCASMADVFEDHPAWDAERPKLWELIEKTPALDWLLLTKRPENIRGMAPTGWLEDLGWPQSVWLGTTAENQGEFDRRAPYLATLPAPVRFLSCEPLLGPLDAEAALMEEWANWVIAGGESGSGARPSHPDWFRSLRDQCQAAGVPFHFKQWGAWAPLGTGLPVRGWCSDGDGSRGGKELITIDGADYLGRFPHRDLDGHLPTGASVYEVGKKRAGRILDGREWSEMPTPRPELRAGGAR